MKTDRKKLHQDLMKIKRKGNYYVKDILDFILEDRKRVVEPLVIAKSEAQDKSLKIEHIAILYAQANYKTLKNAGLDGDT